MSMSETSNGTGGGSIGGDSDSSSFSETTKVCRDFMRNVCQRPQCRFLHPTTAKVRTDPIFCHDFQSGRCFRTTCKFVHCTKEDEDLFRKTGELPFGVSNPVDKGPRITTTRNGFGNNRNNNNKALSARGGGIERVENESVPIICKDFIKGNCDRGPRGCKYRHVNPKATPPTYGNPVMVRGRGGVRMMMAPVVVSPPSNNNNNNRRKAQRSVDHYDNHIGGPPEPKRFHAMDEYYEEEEEDEEEDYEIIMEPPPPPPRGMLHHHNNQGGYYHQQQQQFPNGCPNPNLGYVAMGGISAPPPPPHPNNNRNGIPGSSHFQHHQHFNHNNNNNNSLNNHLNLQHNNNNHNDSATPYFHQTPVVPAAQQADSIKSLEDENFMLKRRIEELKSSNEFLLTQNAQLRLNSTLNSTLVGTSVAGVGVTPSLSVSAVSVSAAGPLVSAQPSIIGITSSSLSGSQPSTISISTLPTPVSISQTSQPQIYLPAPQN